MARQISGVVTSNKGDKTIVISAQIRKTHPLYRKQFTITQKYMAHDENHEAQIGDLVIITETRPISKRKSHRLLKVVEKPKLRQEALVHTKAEEKTVSRPDAKAKTSPEEGQLDQPAKEKKAL